MPASKHEKPLIAVNHLEGHALSPRLAPGGATFPYLLLLVSGGHCQFIAVLDVGVFPRYGSTMDDALGEAFDKLAKLLDLGFPGGPLVEKVAQNGDSKRFALPRPLLHRDGCDFSFAGLKTACAREVERLGAAINDRDKADLCASFQAACSTSSKIARALRWSCSIRFGVRRAGWWLREVLQPTRRSVAVWRLWGRSAATIS